jgi:hypothetical protein
MRGGGVQPRKLDVIAADIGNLPDTSGLQASVLPPPGHLAIRSAPGSVCL